MNIIISSSFDYRVHIWNLEGVKLGTDLNWNVKIDTSFRIESARKEAVELLETSQKMNYEDVILELSTMKKSDTESEESEEEEVDKTKSIFAKLDMSFPSRNKSTVPVKTESNMKSLNVSRIEQNGKKTVPPRRTLSNSGRKIVNLNNHKA